MMKKQRKKRKKVKAQLIEVIKWRYYEIINENIINLINQMNNCVLNSFFFMFLWLLLDAVLARVATEKRLSLIKAWEESEKSKAENRCKQILFFLVFLF